MTKYNNIQHFPRLGFYIERFQGGYRCYQQDGYIPYNIQDYYYYPKKTVIKMYKEHLQSNN